VNKSMLAVLNTSERLLVAETERAELERLNEDEVVALHNRVRTARNKYVQLYRRQASARVVEHGARGVARPKNQRDAMKAEVFEEVLSRVSRRLATLSRDAAGQLRAERLAAARDAKATAPAPTAPRPAGRTPARSVTEGKSGDRSLRSPVSKKTAASTRAQGSRRQAKRDSR
jgi:hypothetical protein